jgi:DNA repair protein RecO (recombination protein O)
MFYRGRDLDTVTSVDVLESHSALRLDYDRLTAAAALVEAVEKITPDREKAFSTYALLLSGLQALVEKGPSAIVPAFLLKLLSVSGYHPQLTACAHCGEGRGLYGFSSSLGGVICGRCRVEDRTAIRISPDRIALLSRLLASDFGQQADPAALAEITHTLRRYAEYHLERPLRSVGLASAP